jgi:hypothetical protein
MSGDIGRLIAPAFCAVPVVAAMAPTPARAAVFTKSLRFIAFAPLLL